MSDLDNTEDVKPQTELDLLKDELQRILPIAKELGVNHTEVAKSIGIGYEYSRQIRNDEDKHNVNSAENRSTVKKLIAAYRKAIEDKKRFFGGLMSGSQNESVA